MMSPIILGYCSILIFPLVFCTNTLSSNNSAYILPTNLKPTFYQLSLFPDLNNKSFLGFVQITFDVKTSTDTLVLHLDNNYIKLLNNPNVSAVEPVKIVSITFDSIHQFVNIKLDKTLSVQTAANISINYSGYLCDDNLGFYLSTYQSSSVTHTLAITQFEATYARRAFPCFDEPRYRAKFAISIRRHSNQKSMSNMGIEAWIPEDDGTVSDVYKTSPPMPTYLVAFGVSDLVNISNPTNFSVLARQDIIQYANYSLSIGPSILDKLGNYLGIAYPLEKMDVVAVPDFDAGAMENWGLTTFREKYVIYDQLLNTWQDKFMVLSVIAHEFAHQWFGDLVTPEKWDYAWLNEAFATYFEYIIPLEIEPSWKMGNDQFVINAVQYALAKDTGVPRPVTSPVYTSTEINDSFDYVIYEKGGSILRMAENFLTTAVWKAGLHKYLTDNEYGTGNPEELFLSFQPQDNIDINETLQGWTTQPGYPLITILATTSSINGSGPVYNITQTPYEMNTSIVWNVPLRYTTQSEQQFDAAKAPNHWLLPSNPNTSTISINETGWVLFNVDQIGFYRVNYDTNNWAKLRNQLQTNCRAIGRINRAQLLDDAFHLGRTGHMDYHEVIKLTRYIPTENETAPWNAFFIHMRYLMNEFTSDSPTGTALKKYAQSVVSAPFKALVNNLTGKPSSFYGALTVQYLSLFACDIGLPICEDWAINKFASWSQNNTNNVILPEFQQAVICTALRKDSAISFKTVWSYFLASNNAAEKLTLMRAMGCITDQTTITLYLDYVCNVSTSYVRLQDRWIVFRALASYQVGVIPVINYLAKNFDKASNALGQRISIVMSQISHTVSQPDQIKFVENLVNDPGVNVTLKTMLNATVLPAIYKRQNWANSEPALSLQKWAKCYLSSSATPQSFSVYVIVASMALYYNFM